MARGRDTDAFAHVLALALSRVFVDAPAISDLLLAKPSDTLHALSRSPGTFGTLRVTSRDQDRDNLIALLTAARAFVVASRRASYDLTLQLDLPLF